jgi:hypothetical protein
VVALTVIAGDASGATRVTSSSAASVQGSPARGSSGGSSSLVKGNSGPGGGAIVMPIGQAEENAKNIATPAPTAAPYPGAASCLQSTNPACGPFRWAQAINNRPLTVSFTYSPQSPMVGQPVTFTIFVTDPDDANDLQIDGAYFGDESSIGGVEGGVSATTANGPAAGCQTPYGTWTAPGPGVSGHLEKQMTFTYANPGPYQVDFTASSGQPAGACLPDPYASTGQSAVQTVTVSSPPPPPATTTTTSSTTTVPAPTTTTTVPTTDTSS